MKMDSFEPKFELSSGAILRADLTIHSDLLNNRINVSNLGLNCNEIKY